MQLRAVILFITLFLPLTGLQAQVTNVGKLDPVEFIAPIKNQVVRGVPVKAEIQFNVPVDTATFSAALNGENITHLFTVGPQGATASLRIEDGLRTAPETPADILARNKIDVEVSAAGNAKPKKQKAKTQFFFDPSSPQDPNRVTAIIPPTGGQITLPGFGSVVFPSGAFATNQLVELFVTSDPETAEIMRVSGTIFGAGPTATFEFRVNTGAVAPTTPVTANFEVPVDLLSQIPINYELAVFAQVRQESEIETLDTFERFITTISSPDGAVTTSLPTFVFTNKRLGDGTFEAITVLGTAPTPPADALAPASRICSPNDIHRILAPPLDETLEITVTQTGVVRQFNPSLPHLGVDYRTLDRSVDPPLPVEGLLVRSVADGKVDFIPTGGSAADKTGWGNYVVIVHDDKTRALYAHLQDDEIKKIDGTPLKVGDRVVKDEVIARSGQTAANGTTTNGPHLHLEFTNIAVPIQSGSQNEHKVDIHPCISRKLYVANPINFTGNPGTISRYDGTQDLAPMSRIPSGVSESGTRHIAAFNRKLYVNGAGEASLVDESTLSSFVFTGADDGIGASRSGVFALQNHLELGSGTGSDALVFRFNHDGTGQSIFATIVADQNGLSEKRIAVNDKRVVAIDDTKAFIYDMSGAIVAEIPQETVFFSGAATQDRIFLADHIFVSPNLFGNIRVFDNNGIEQNVAVSSLPGRIFGVAVTEKHLYVSLSDADIVRVFKRTVTRNRLGEIISESYVFDRDIPEFGFPMGLTVE